jgi:TolB-like protein
MAPDANRLLALAEAVADGRDVDWLSVESSAHSRGEQELIAELRLLAGVAGVHRGAALEDETTHGADSTAAGASWRGLELRELIGAGSFGSVYRAHDPRLGRDVALKLLRAGSDDEDATVVNEGRLLARVRHPHVITVHGADRHEGRAGIWMEFIQGRTLEVLLKEQGPFGAREAALIGEQLCSALAAVHAQGLIHRDIKTHNVMREAGGRVVLMDFGAGEDHEAATVRPRRATGTPLYMAPELFAGGSASPASDLYSLGVLLFRLVSGSYPVSGTTSAEVRAAHEAGRRQRLRDVRPDLPSAFIDVVERAVAEAPADRFPSAGAMEAALADAFRLPPAPLQATRHRPVIAAVLGLVALALAATVLRFGSAIWPAPVTTIAVLPLQNLTGAADQEYLVAGISDLLLTRLHGLDALRVIPPSSTAAIADDPQRVARAANELGAEYLLEGSVGRSNGRVALSVRLIAAGSGVLEWGRTYDRQVTDLFTVQGEIATAVASAVRASVGDGEVPSEARLYTTSATAQDAYLRGRYLLYRFDRAVLQEAREAFETAVAVDPQFALAQASLARTYLMVEAYGLASVAEIRPLALAAASTAVDLAPDLSEARVALAEVKFKALLDWAGADAEYREAVRLAPYASVVRSPYSRFLSAAGRPDEALDHAEAGLKADPLSAEMLASVGITQYYLRRHDEAIATFDAVTIAHPRYGPGFFGRARARSARGDYEAAIEDIKQALALSGGETSYGTEMARVHAAAGWRNTAEQILGELLAQAGSGTRAVAPQDLAWVYAALGDRDRALDLLAEALDAHQTRVLFLRVDPRADPVRQDPRFETLLGKLGSIGR